MFSNCFPKILPFMR